MSKKTSLMGLIILLSAFNYAPSDAKTNINSQKSQTVEERLAHISYLLQAKTEAFDHLSAKAPTQIEKNPVTRTLRLLLAEVTQWRNGPAWNDGTGFGNWRNRWRDFNPFIDFRNS